MMKEGGLGVSLDYDSAWTSSAMKECHKFISDDIDQFLFTKGEGIYFGGTPDHIYADLGEVVAGIKLGRQDPKEKIFSMNMGIAIDDMVTAKMVYERAVEKGVGTDLPL
jgi:ornithine cyclodeaminase/alanine dehydrogenase